MANEVLAKIRCDACGHENAGVKRNKRGKKHLYIHCPKCGCDQRSGAAFQAKLERKVTAALTGEDIPEPVVVDTKPPKAESDKTEWTPEVSPEAKPENKPQELDPPKNKTKTVLKWLMGAVTLGIVVVTVR